MVLAAAAATFDLWAWLGPEPRIAYALVNGVAVLIIACPCALGLATPMQVQILVDALHDGGFKDAAGPVGGGTGISRLF